MDASTRHILDLTRELIRFPSTASRPDARKECADFLERHLIDAGLPARRIAHEGVDSILCLPDSPRCKVLLMAHLDVVDAAGEQFIPREEDGKLFGRGAIDDKYAVALSLFLAAKYAAAPGLLGVLITGDEEAGGENGARHALKHVQAGFCIALDGGTPTNIVTLEKGALRLQVTARGKAAHGARPWLGENAIEKLMRALAALPPLFEASGPDHWHRTLNIGIVKGGAAVNMVPSEAHAVLDVRHTEHDDPDGLIAQIRAAASGCEVTELSRLNLFSGGHHPLLEALLRHAPAASLGRAHGASDARFLSEHGVPGVVWGAEGGGSQHSANEFLVIESLERLLASLDGFLAEVAGT
jgi:succinyl-diaminopimelate desuccinylase